MDAYLDIKPWEKRSPESAYLSPDPVPLVLVTADGTHVKIWVYENWLSDIIKKEQPTS